MWAGALRPDRAGAQGQSGQADHRRQQSDKALRSRPIAGLTILSGFAAAGDHWSGRIYDPRSGRTYRSELRRESGTLKVKGCFGPFCRTQVWTRAN